jgi:tetratricopeptide (TPR) repeat protein
MMAYIYKSRNFQQQGLLEKARATLEEMPTKTDQESIGFWHTNWARQEILERNLQAALEHINSDFVEAYAGEKALWAGDIYRLMNDPEHARDSFESARILLEKGVKEQPDDSSAHALLGLAYAGLGRKENAIREGKLAVKLYPVSKDAYEGPGYVGTLAHIYVMAGEHEQALDQIEYLLSIPNRSSEQLLQLNPIWDPLREHPRFKKLLEKYSE